MRVLVVEDVEGAARPVVDELVGAGHAVAFCHDPEGSGFPCNGLHETPTCPLDGAPVDLAVVVRSDCGEAPTSRETGAACAIRRHIPLVEVGQHQHSPYLGLTAGISQGPESVVHAVEYTATHPLPRHTVEARRVFRQVLDVHELTWVSADAEVHRCDGSLHIRLLPDLEIPKQVAEVAGVRVSGAIRALDPDALTISVSLPTISRGPSNP